MIKIYMNTRISLKIICCYICLDESSFTNGYLDTPLDWIDGMKNVRLRDMPSFIQTTDPDDIMVNINIKQCEDDAPRATGIILNTFEDLEYDVLQAILRRYINWMLCFCYASASHINYI
jgi:hypothetical protein